MTYQDFMKKVRYVDNIIARWMMRHFYFMFFQMVLVIIFVIWFINVLRVIDVNFEIVKESILQRILIAQTINTTILVIVMILNSFWLLYIFNVLQRQKNIMKDVNYNILRLRNRHRQSEK
ncbi:MAG: hypothetical protein K8S27_07440 [Candidatus Omnitrophica bacterium]|nr:hypothetical protein [Candidatus Omnitrophota bacterium]